MFRKLFRVLNRTLERKVPRMPEEVRELRNPWPTLVGRLDGLTPDLEREFRFGQSVIPIDGQYRLGGNIKGGSSSMWIPTDEATYHTYVAWRDLEGIPRRSSPRTYDRLKKLLTTHGITLTDGTHGSNEEKARRSDRRGAIYDFTYRTLVSLPPAHLANPLLGTLQIGGWGPDGAKGSAYDQGRVFLYDFAVGGARRTFLGLLLHEMGHAVTDGIQTLHRSRLEEKYRIVAHPDTLIGVEFLLDGHSRKIYQMRVFEEFLADTYMAYAAFGQGLLEVTSLFPKAPREAWRDIYQTFRELFHGYEYPG
jgi:hypothetical protein